MAVTPEKRQEHDERTLMNGATDRPSERARFHINEIRQIIALMNTSDLTEIAIHQPELGRHLVLRRKVAQSATPDVASVPVGIVTAQPQATILASSDAANGHVPVTAPLVGRFHVAMKAGQKPLVAVGDVVHEGQLVGGIETLHVMNEVEATVSGTIVAVLVEDGQPVQYGQHIFMVDPQKA